MRGRNHLCIDGNHEVGVDEVDVEVEVGVESEHMVCEVGTISVHIVGDHVIRGLESNGLPLEAYIGEYDIHLPSFD